MLIVNTQIQNAGSKGLGLFAAEKIDCHQLVWLEHSVLDIKLSTYEVKRLPKVAKAFIDKYASKDKDGMYYLDSDNCKFMNHSITPNVKFTDKGIGAAIRDIAIGEEMTCNYYDIVPRGKDYKLDFTEK